MQQKIHFQLTFALFISLLLIIFFCLSFSFYHVQGTSMMPNIHDGQTVIIWNYAYRLYNPISHMNLLNFSSPKRGDIVLLEHPQSHTLIIKRISAIPFDEITEKLVSADYAGLYSRLPPGYYAVLGDNLEHSEDSRHFGPIAQDAIIGKVLACE